MLDLKLKIPPLLLTSLFGLVMWVISLSTKSIIIPDVTRLVLSLVLVALGFIVSLSGVASFRVAKTTVNPLSPSESTSLVTTGVYKFSRNPMYVAMASILVGIVFFFGNIASFLSVVLFCWIITQFQIKPEEKVLTEMFGQSFLDYSQRTRRWI